MHGFGLTKKKMVIKSTDDANANRWRVCYSNGWVKVNLTPHTRCHCGWLCQLPASWQDLWHICLQNYPFKLIQWSCSLGVWLTSGYVILCDFSHTLFMLQATFGILKQIFKCQKPFSCFCDSADRLLYWSSQNFYELSTFKLGWVFVLFSRMRELDWRCQ